MDLRKLRKTTEISQAEIRWKLGKTSFIIIFRVNLNKSQLERTSEIMGNITVAWFSAGVITPLFVRPKNIIDFITLLSVGLLMAGLFYFGLIHLIRRVRI